MRITHDTRLTAGSANKGTLQRGPDLAQMVVVRWGTGSHHNRAAPAVGAANNICLSQTILSATTGLINGSLATSGLATLDVPRGLQIVSTNAGDTTQTATARGFDEYGEALTETRTMNGTNVVNFLKGFKQVASITFSAALAGSFTLGTSNRLTLPFRTRTGDVLTFTADGAVEAGTKVAADTATPTAATGDIRGAITPTTTPNGTVQFTALCWISDTGQDAVGGELGQYKA